jgi:cbb3-type cytochrome oxidase subunit 3
MRKGKLIQRGLLFAVPIIVAGMLATIFLGFVIGFILVVFMFIGVILYIQRKASKERGFNAQRGGYYDGNSSSSAGFSTKPSYVCLACDSKVSERTCGKCGSHMKKAVFK